MEIAVVGAGFSGAVIARELAKDHNVTVFESRDHVAGNCHTARDPETNVMVHVYGPHIFHTGNDRVWEYINRFGEIVPYFNRPKAIVQDRREVFSLPINLHTINQYFHKMFTPNEARDYLTAQGGYLTKEPENFEEQAIKFIGPQLYWAFMRGYTMKQWGRNPTELPASILKRLPLRFNYNDNYFEHPHQGIPRDGYTNIVANILAHSQIEVKLKTHFDSSTADQWDHVFYSGPIDGWYLYRFGPLPYRTLTFVPERSAGDAQGTAVINYCDPNVPWTRVTEFKHFTPWETHPATITYREFSREAEADDIPFYPIRLAVEQAQLAKYLELARTERSVTFVGRLGTFTYLDMDVTIAQALDTADLFLGRRG